MRHGGAVAAALLLDGLCGEPAEAIHPTVWMGRAISACERRALKLKRPVARRAAGVVLAGTLPVLVFLLTRAALNAAPGRLRLALEAALMSTSLSMRGLARAAEAVDHELAAGRLAEARSSVGEFVGRDTADLSAADVCRAAVESVAENTSDGVVAPMLYGFLLGAPGALAYKAVNTVDSMVGYRAEPYADLGWAGARLDDLANLAPSRLTVLAVAVASARPARTLKTAGRYGPLTSSPNAGRAEASFAGALGVRLGGANSYRGAVLDGPVLGDGRVSEAADIRRAVGLMRRCCVLLALIALLAGELRRG